MENNSLMIWSYVWEEIFNLLNNPDIENYGPVEAVVEKPPKLNFVFTGNKVWITDRKAKVFVENTLGMNAKTYNLTFNSNYKGKIFWMVIINNKIDALDLSNMEFTDISGSLLFIMPKTYAFKYEVIKTELVFTVPEREFTDIFATEKFKELIETEGLTGLEFELVWDSE